jgi:transmembrane sensor
MDKHIQNIVNNFSNSSTDEKIIESSKHLEVPFTLSSEEALAKLKSRIQQGNTSTIMVKPVKKLMIYRISAVAASLLLVFAGWYTFVYNANLNIVADKGQHTNITLPDGSNVDINAASTITFSKNDFTSERKLKLSGEAFFMVKKGKTFTIKTEMADIRILGTSFNVYSRDSVFKVSCVTGKIWVGSGKQSVIITPGESAEIKNNSILVKYTENNIQAIANWRKGEFNYENSDLVKIFDEIERQYNVTFVLPNINNKFFTGSISNKNLVDALDIVCIPMGLTYEIGSNSKVYIREKSE